MTLLVFLVINQFGFQTARKRQVEEENAKGQGKGKLGKVLRGSTAEAEQPSSLRGQRHLGL